MGSRERLLLTGILITGAALRFWGLAFGVPHSETRPDETTVVVTAIGLLYAGLNPHFFHWPSLEFYLVSAIYRIGWEIGHLRGLYRLKFDMYKDAAVRITPFLMVPRVLSAIAGVVTIWLVYRLANRLFDRLTALTAAFFMAVAFLHVRDSHFGVTDVPMTALVIGALCSLSLVFEYPERIRRWMLAGVLAGLAASTKYNGGLVVASAVAVAMWLAARGDAAIRRATVRGVAAFTGSVLIAFLAATPYAILDASHFLEDFRFEVNHLAEGHQIILEPGWMYHFTYSLWYGLGAPLLISGLAGLCLLVARFRKQAALICAFPFVYYAVAGRGLTVFVRYMTPVTPFLCMAAALFIVWSVRRLIRPERVSVVVAVAAVVIALPSLQRSIAFNTVMARTDTRVLAADWVSAHVRPQEAVGQIPPVLIYENFGMTKPANLVTFDVNRKAFVSASGTAVVPDILLVPTSPLDAYTVTANELAAIANRDYVREGTIAATHGVEMPNWFDKQDLFFVPFTTFTMRDRPGPEIQIFRRRLQVPRP
jgi:hypothetical protein